MIESTDITIELIDLIEMWEPRLKSLSEEKITGPRNTQNRSIKMILGHLIDSSSNNIHRIIHLQNLPSPLTFPNYASLGNNDRWIAIQNYQSEDWNDMIQLWKYSNFHLCHIIRNADKSKFDKEWIAGPGRLISLKDMITDYLRHFKLHLSEINDLISTQVLPKNN
ncbi:MAG TPA: hypothetical protein VMT63_11570 [Bacteroidales bacterium]|nr:hypothetical protein [Bacteroidales bacterium]